MRFLIAYRERYSWKAILPFVTSTARLFLGAGIVAVQLCQAQTSTPGFTLRFEVASVRSCNTDTTFVGGAGRNSPGRVFLNCQAIRGLILRAYSMYKDGRPNPNMVSPNAILGGPTWIDSDRYTIEAKAVPPQPEGIMMGPMLRSLLEERFRLRVHRDSREIPVYELVVAKNGPRLQPTKEASCAPFDPTQPPSPPKPGQRAACGIVMPAANGGLITYGQTIPGLCRYFSGPLGRPVIDKTGIPGAFDIQLDLAPKDLVPQPPGLPGDGDSSASSPMASVRFALGKLGLKLENAKGAGEFLVIDHVEKPAGN
jgi:uncharacterized protein (TIGR03435 family)